MARLDKERQEEKEPKRMAFAIKELEKLGLKIIGVNTNSIKFSFKNNIVLFYPYSGWHTGKSIKDGRGSKR